MPERISTFGRKINLVETRDFQHIVSEFIRKPAQSAIFCNVHMLMLSQEDTTLASAMEAADWVFADGVPVSWLQRRISGKDAKVIRGYEIMMAVCDLAARTGEKIGLLGSTDDVLEALASNLCERYKGLKIVYRYSPAFMQGELTSTKDELESIKDAGVEWLFVGLGCPKQEKWIARYKGDLNCNILGVGAAFDWISGKVSMPPRWMESSGLGWLHRLFGNPSKLWHRYFVYNSKFLYKVLKMSFGKSK